MDEMQDLRCPVYPSRLFARVKGVVDLENLVEVACRDCRRDAREAGEDVVLVVHRFNMLGVHVDTVLVPSR